MYEKKLCMLLKEIFVGSPAPSAAAAGRGSTHDAD
jgi:hypothetical protein